MTANITRIRTHIQNFSFEDLFIEELGWDQYRDRLDIVVNGDTIRLNAFAEKRGMVTFTMGNIPDSGLRRKIEQQVARVHRENIIIYADSQQGEQVWQWVRREPGKPLMNREGRYQAGNSGESIAQILSGIAFSLDEEDSLTIVDVTSRVRAAFDVEKVTKKFYDRFKKQHDAFLAFIEGIPDAGFQRWYASVMLNRLMFIYFVQRKGFLDNDTDYLRNRLARTDGNFYRDFLIPLFFKGFAEKDHSAETRRLLGDVPYLNGGLFLPHQIESDERYGKTIQIENEAFEKLFDFFDEYHWHLDERPLRNDNEINPDVLGYIFEKYINQKQMGAYYTKEDITEYISKNTVIPFLFDQARKAVQIAFEGDHTVWDLLADNPDRYIYPAVQHGMEHALPEHIAAGLDDVNQRGDWNVPAPPEYALPTEIWREVVARRTRYAEVRGKLERGEVHEINDLITLNLDIQQFAQDVIAYTDSPDVVRAFWSAINSVTVLDPTCGSGAFLFAALNILEPLYEACLERMGDFLADMRRTNAHPQQYSDFRAVMERIDRHPNRRYFILKSIIVNNLFGVDIMEEAIEIAKLRLFLKLVAQVDDKDRIEPLPDIDFNIRAGNTLVGFATEAEFKGRLFAQSIIPRMEILQGTVETFRREQLKDHTSPEEMHRLKTKVNGVLKELTDLLDQNLMEDYGQSDLAAFRASHKPFHWFVEFYGVLKSGGFDVIIGNPPYVEYSKVRKEYQVVGYKTEKSGNLYGMCMERCVNITRVKGRSGLVVQQPFVSTQRMKLVRNVYLDNSSLLAISTYDDRPSKLFDGIHHARIAIVIAEKQLSGRDIDIFVTRYNKWYSDERATLFQTIGYVSDNYHEIVDVFPKTGSRLEGQILSKVIRQPKTLEVLMTARTPKARIYYKITGVGHWFTITMRPPKFIRQGKKSSSTRESTMDFETTENRNTAFILLNSTLFYWFYQMRTNCRDFNPSDYKTFPIPSSVLQMDFTDLAMAFQEHLDSSTTMWSMVHKKTGEVQIEQFRPREGKSVADEIDRALARHYGFTDEELDFIINYDIKYRMGDDLGGDEEGE
jgi:hypothetical protein